MKYGKVTRPYNILVEVWKNFGNLGIEMLWDVIIKIYEYKGEKNVWWIIVYIQGIPKNLTSL